jgi:indole-3-glycerol phosphate synthase
VLARILDSTREELTQRKRAVPQRQLEERLPQRSVHSLHAALTAPDVSVIAEFKRRSPSAGVLRESADVGEMIGAYGRGGAAALSVLTEGPSFGGSLEDLRVARGLSDQPILRKDFIVDEYQLLEARVAGADAVLLIVAALDGEQLGELHERARRLGLDVLVEVHDSAELERAAAIGAEIIGVNNRDLRDFSIDVERTARLIAEVPPGALVVSESGIVRAEQLARLQQQGADAVLVGETLMRADDPAVALADLRCF